MIQKLPQGWHIEYLRLRYSEQFDCVALVQKVLREQFNQHLEIPPAVLPQRVTAGVLHEGDIIQSIDARGRFHLGVVVIIGAADWMLHNSQKNRGVTLDRFMPQHLKLENIYRLK